MIESEFDELKNIFIGETKKSLLKILKTRWKLFSMKS